jgi:hypothetical protein
MRILVTGARGKLGAATLDTLLRAGHEVTAVDRLPPVYERAGQVRYIQADLTDAGHAAAVLPGHDAVVHAAGIPSPVKNPPHEILQTNLMATYSTRPVRPPLIRCVSPVHSLRGPEFLDIVALPESTPGPSQTLYAVSTTGLNHGRHPPPAQHSNRRSCDAAARWTPWFTAQLGSVPQACVAMGCLLAPRTPKDPSVVNRGGRRFGRGRFDQDKRAELPGVTRPGVLIGWDAQSLTTLDRP